MQIVLEKSMLLEPEAAQDYLAEVMEFPDYYGRNLDALYDCLTDISQPVQIMIASEKDVPVTDYLRRLIGVMKDAALDNEMVSLIID